MPYLSTHLFFRHDCQIHKLEAVLKSSRNATCPRCDTCKTTSFGLMTRVWDFTVVTTSHGRDSTVAMATWVWNKCQGIAMTMTARIWNGVTWTAEWIWDELAWLAKWARNGIACCIWDVVTWTGKPYTVEFNYVTDVAAKYYGKYLDSK